MNRSARRGDAYMGGRYDSRVGEVSPGHFSPGSRKKGMHCSGTERTWAKQGAMRSACALCQTDSSVRGSPAVCC